MTRSAQSVAEFAAAAAEAFKAFPSNTDHGTKKMGDSVNHLLINDNSETGHLLSRTSLGATFQLHYSPNGDITFCSMRPEVLDFIVRSDGRLQGSCEIPSFVPEIIRKAIIEFAPDSDYAKGETKRRFERMFGGEWSEHAPENCPVPFAVPA